MKLEDQVCTIEQSKRLFELGILARSCFQFDGNGYIYRLHEKEMVPDHERDIYAAYTVAELGEMLRSFLPDTKHVLLSEGTGSIEEEVWNSYYGPSGEVNEVVELDTVFTSTGPTEAQQRADLLIRAIEQNPELINDINNETH